MSHSRRSFRFLFLLLTAAACLRLPAAVSASDRANWMQGARWGVMNHYLADWISQTTGMEMTVDKWNELVDHFDVNALADQLQSVGAGYYMISIGQSSGYFLSPNATYDRITGITPSKCSHRDLIADLYQALHKRGIRLMVYLPSHAPYRDEAAMAAFDYKRGPYPNLDEQQKWEAVIREWSERWGKEVCGWWFDGVYWPNTMYRRDEAPNFESFAAAARAGNPDSVVAFNPGVLYRAISLTPDEDFTAGEVNDPSLWGTKHDAEGKIDGAQLHILTYMGRTWGKGEPRFSIDQVVEYSQKLAAVRGVITWDVPIQTNGTMAQPFMERLAAVGKALGALQK